MMFCTRGLGGTYNVQIERSNKIKDFLRNTVTKTNRDIPKYRNILRPFDKQFLINAFNSSSSLRINTEEQQKQSTIGKKQLIKLFKGQTQGCVR